MALPVMPIAFYETETYNSAASIQDNVLLGRVSNTVAEGYERVTAAIRDLLDELELTDDVFRMGLTFNIGSGGKRLSETQRQKLHLARALIKCPDILVANQPLNSLGSREQEDMIKMVFERVKGSDASNKMGIIWAPMQTALAEMFDRILIFEDGELVEDGPADKIVSESPRYKELIG
jgi:putative ABC transport system ATP-binding protein